MVIMGIYSFIRLVLIRGTQTVFDFIYFGNQHYGGKKLGTAQANARSSEGCSKIFRSSAGDSATLRQRANQLSIGGPCRHMFVIVVFFFSHLCGVFRPSQENFTYTMAAALWWEGTCLQSFTCKH